MTDSDSPNPELRDLVTIRQFAELPSALLAKSILESAGIECFLGDDNLIRMDWFWSNLLGGVKLLVRREDSDAAERLLTEGIPGTTPVELPDDSVQPHCPACGSAAIPFHELTGPAAGIESKQEAPAPLSRVRWRCSACGHEWTESADPAR